MSQAGILDIEASNPQIPTSFDTDSGTAIPILNILEVLGTNGITTSGAGNTVTVTGVNATAAATVGAAQIGVCAFDSVNFSVTAGFVELIGGGSGIENILSDDGVPEIEPNGSGLVNIIGGSGIVTSGQGPGNTLTISVNSSIATSYFCDNSASAIPVAGVLTVTGGTVAAGTSPLVTSAAGSTVTINAQTSQALAATDATKIGLCNFDSAAFSVDANGFVSINGSGVGTTITGTTGGALSPTAGNWNILGQDGITTSGATSTLTITPRGAGTGNMFLGEGAGNLTLSGIYNVSFGSLSSPALTSGNNNVSVGISAGNKINSGGSNISIGRLANALLTTGSNNIAIGLGACDANVSSSSNIAIGSNALTACTGASNVAIGASAAGALVSGTRTVAVGHNALVAATGLGNTAIGYQSLPSLTSGIENTCIGDTTGTSLVSGNYNTAIGVNAGAAWTGSDTSNVAVGNDGVAGDNNTMRLGQQGVGASEVDSCFIAGIVGVTVSNAVSVVIDSTTGEMGVGPIQQVFPVTLLDNTDSPYTALAAEYMYSCNVSAGILTINLPNAPTTGRAFVVKDTGGNANTNNITITTVGGVVTIDGSTTFVMNTNYQSSTLIFNGTSYAVI